MTDYISFGTENMYSPNCQHCQKQQLSIDDEIENNSDQWRQIYESATRAFRGQYKKWSCSSCKNISIKRNITSSRDTYIVQPHEAIDNYPYRRSIYSELYIYDDIKQDTDRRQ
jgi:hypothetical protein